LFVAAGRTPKFTFAWLVEKATRRAALQELIKMVPYQIHTVLTDNSTHFTSPGNTRSTTPDIKLDVQSHFLKS